jgi:hypothetical protein
MTSVKVRYRGYLRTFSKLNRRYTEKLLKQIFCTLKRVDIFWASVHNVIHRLKTSTFYTAYSRKPKSYINLFRRNPGTNLMFIILERIHRILNYFSFSKSPHLRKYRISLPLLTLAAFYFLVHKLRRIDVIITFTFLLPSTTV